MLISLLLAGCNQNPFVTPQSPPGMPVAANQASPTYTAQLQDLDRRASNLDADNRDLHAALARKEQERKLLADEVALLRSQLSETAGQLQAARMASQEANQKVQAIEASTRRRGSATITANNSLRDELTVADFPGFDVRTEGDVIRIEVPSDRLFHARSAQMLPSATYMLDELAEAIKRNYPRQMIGIEGHTDNTPTGTTTNHQLASTQATAVFAALTRRGHLPSQQLFIVAHGANHPRMSNSTPSGRSRNRRIELVIYPETVRGN
jgi:outer membrane protein OmpA-like peptidoglycan-associated protein